MIKELPLRDAILASRDAIIIADALLDDNPLVFVNPAFEEMTGYLAEEVLLKNCRFLQKDDREQPELEVIRESLKNGEPCFVRLRNYRKDGTLFWNELSISPVRDDSGKLTYFVGILRDVTKNLMVERQLDDKTKKLEAANRELLEKTHNLKHVSYIDELTGIANRKYFDELLEIEWNRAIRHVKPITLVIIDIDYFKQFNDIYDYTTADNCLKRVATALSEVVTRPGDIVTRFGGAKFMVILPDTDDGALVATRCREAVEQLRIPHRTSRVSNVVTASVGFSTVKPSIGLTSSTIRKTADHALHQAKHAGRNRIAENSRG